jgi:hypothetical protein
LLASLESELSDSASLRYLRRRFATPRRLANPFSPQKAKRQASKDVCLFGYKT